MSPGRHVVFVTGRDPRGGKGGGSNYVRAHARAAAIAGFQSHIVCLGRREESVESELGAIHRAVSPYWPRGPMRSLANSETLAGGLFDSVLRGPYGSGLHRRALAARCSRLLRSLGGAAMLHGFSAWGAAAAEAAEAARGVGRRATCATSFYATAEAETRARVAGCRGLSRPLARSLFLAERAWVLAVAERQERRAYRRSDVVLVNYEVVRRALEQRWGTARETRLVPYGPEAGLIPIPPPAADAALDSGTPPKNPLAPLIVCASRHDPRKGIDRLLQALAHLRARGAAFRACILGGGPLLETHRRLAARLDLSASTVLTGWVPNIAPYLRAADLFVLPSLHEGSGSIALLEALQAEIAVIASAVDGLPEDVAAEESALLVSAGDVRALAGAIERALTDAPLRRRLARKGREVFDRRFAGAVFIESQKRLYEELFDKARARA